MAKSRSPNREKAFELYKECHGKITSREIAKRLGENIKNIQYWRNVDNWKEKYKPQGGAPYGNQNALGNKGGSAPKGNYNSFKYGNYTKRIPFAVKSIIEELDVADPLERLWRSICLQEARIIYMQNIMHVENKDDMTKEIKKSSSGKAGESIEYEIQFAWDKEANFMNTLSRAMSTLGKLIKQYDEMLHANWDTVTEEQRLRVERLRTQVDDQKKDHKKKLDEEKLQLQKDRFEHQKDIDSKKYW